MGYVSKLGFGQADKDSSARAKADGVQPLYLRRHFERLPYRLELANSPDAPDFDRGLLEKRVSEIISERRKRSAFFPHQLFTDPAWEILLALTLAEARQHRMAVTSLCASVELAPTTVLRWIQTLVGHGILIRHDDKIDRRRKYVELSRVTLAKMVEYMSAISASHPCAA